MKVANKLITILIAITLVFNFVILENFNVYANTVENIDKNDIPDIIKTYENPIYKGLNIKEYSPKENINSKSVPIFNTLEEAAVFVRDEMVNRKGNISFILPYELYYREICIDIVHLAMKDSDNGKSSEGDYLAKHYSGFGVSTKWHTNTQLQYNLEMRYLSTYEQEEQVDKAVKEVLEDLDIEEKDDYTKIKLIHDYIVENIRYDYTKNHYSAYNAIIDKSVKCQGFSTLTYKMLKESGLKVRYISGTSDTGRHGWNIVKLGDKWYNIDNTWDSCYSESGPISYTWFLKGMNDFPKHYRNSEYNTSEFNKNYPMATTAYNYITATGITLDKYNISMMKGDTQILKATVSPSNATNKNVTWASSNTTVAKVDSNGKVTAVGAGSATITVTTTDGTNLKATCKVTVTNPIKVTSVKLNKTTLSLLKGNSETLKVTISPSNATNKNVTWKSSNENVATVDANGKVNAVGIGEVIITAISTDGTNIKVTCKVTIKSNEEPIKIEFNDIKGHWSEKTIEAFVKKGYINGYEDKTFKPDNSMTRAEFVKVVNKVFGYTQKGEEQFTDVNENDWYYEDICIGIKEGYIKGRSTDIFAPNDNITRQEVAMILTNIMNNKDDNLDKLNTFKDGDKTSQWAQASVEGAIEAGYINGDDEGLLNPTSNITRAEAITMLSRVN